MPQQRIEMTALIDARISEFRATFVDAKFQELDTKLSVVESTFSEIKNKFGEVETKNAQQHSDMDKVITSRLADADAQFKSFQQQLTADMEKASDLFKKTDQLMIQMRKDLTAVQDSTRQASEGAEAKNQQLRSEVEHSIRMVQGSLSSAIGAASANRPLSSGGGSKSRTLDEDKRLEGVGKISGHESLADITEWYSKVMIKLESACPGAGPVLEWAVAQKEEVTTTDIELERVYDSEIAHRLNRELISWMTNVFTSKAWSHAKIAKGSGLEAWRLVHRNITMQGPQQVQLEYGYLLKPTGPPKNVDIAQWITEWEDRASKLTLVSPVHAYPDELRRNMFYEAMPKDVQALIDAERRKGALLEHAALRNWLIALGNQARLAITKGPPPLLNNVNDEVAPIPSNISPPPQPYLYSAADWQEYSQTDEGSELLAAVKGKSKGKGKLSLKGDFQGQCWKCQK